MNTEDLRREARWYRRDRPTSGKDTIILLESAAAEIDNLRAERTKYKTAMESLYTEALLCDANGITLQFVQFVLSKTSALK